MATPGVGDHSDRDLVLAFQAGDTSAYDELYRRHHDRVARVCYRFLHNRPDAEEAAQETFLKAFQALPRFNGQYQVGAWLTRIATNVCVDHLRVRSRSHLVALPHDDGVVGTDRGPEEILAGNDPRLEIAINDMQPLHARALQMRGLHGMSHVEIAGRLQMTPAQVKALLHRARSSFKKAWDKAQGWMLAPLVKTRSFDRSSEVSSASSNLAAISAHAPALAEKAAASVLMVVVALSGAPSTPATRSNVGAAVGEVAPRFETDVRPARVAVDARSVDNVADADAAAAEPEATEDLITALPETVTSTIEGRDTIGSDEDEYGSPGNEGELVPPTVKRSHKKVRDTVIEVIERVRQ